MPAQGAARGSVVPGATRKGRVVPAHTVGMASVLGSLARDDVSVASTDTSKLSTKPSEPQKRRCSLGTALRIAFPLALVASAVAVAVALTKSLHANEESTAEDTFVRTHNAKAATLRAYLEGRRTAVNMVAGSLDVLNVMPSPHQFKRLTAAVVEEGIAPVLLSCSVPNIPAAVEAVAEDLSALHNTSVSIRSVGSEDASEGAEYLFPIVRVSDVPSDPNPERGLGIDLGAAAGMRATITMLNATEDPTSAERHVAIAPFVATGIGSHKMFVISALKSAKLYVSTAATMLTETSAVLEDEENVRAVVTDAAGTELILGNTECKLASNLMVQDTVAFGHSSVTIQFAGCEAYVHTFRTNLRWAVPTFVVLVCMGMAAAWVLLLIAAANRRESAVTAALLLQSKATYGRIIGISHQVRNPLLVLTSWLSTSDGENGIHEVMALPPDEQQAVVADLTSATAQIESTLNEIQELQRLEMLSDKVNSPAPTVLHDVVTPILHSVGLRNGLHYRVLLPPHNTPLCVDPEILGFAVREALTFAASHATTGTVQVSAGVVCGRPPVLAVLVNSVMTRAPIANPDVLFVPFGGHMDSHHDSTQTVWGPAVASKRFRRNAEKLWRRAQRKLSTARHVPVEAEARATHRYARGLGLPVARALCKAAGGWMGVHDSPKSALSTVYILLPLGAERHDGRSPARSKDGPCADVLSQPGDETTAEAGSLPPSGAGSVYRSMLSSRGAASNHNNSATSVSAGPSVATPDSAPRARASNTRSEVLPVVVPSAAGTESAVAGASPTDVEAGQSPSRTVTAAGSGAAATGASPGTSAVTAAATAVPSATAFAASAALSAAVMPGAVGGRRGSERRKPPSPLPQPLSHTALPTAATPLPSVMCATPAAGASATPADTPALSLVATVSRRISLPPMALLSTTGDSPKPQPEKFVVDFATLRVMVVEDELPNVRILQRQLRRLGVAPGNITVLRDGQEMVDHFTQCQPTPDIVLLDLLMPLKSGLEAMAECQPACPVLAVTGNVDDSSVQNCRRSGFTGMLRKPFTGAHLRDAMTSALKPRPSFFVSQLR